MRPDELDERAACGQARSTLCVLASRCLVECCVEDDSGAWCPYGFSIATQKAALSLAPHAAVLLCVDEQIKGFWRTGSPERVEDRVETRGSSGSSGSHSPVEKRKRGTGLGGDARHWKTANRLMGDSIPSKAACTLLFNVWVLAAETDPGPVAVDCGFVRLI
jgi:hypothetical protein